MGIAGVNGGYATTTPLQPDGIALRRFVRAHPGLTRLNVAACVLSPEVCRCMASVKTLIIHECSFVHDSQDILFKSLSSRQSQVSTLHLRETDLDKFIRLFYGHSLSTTSIDRLILQDCVMNGTVAEVIPHLPLKRLKLLQGGSEVPDWAKLAQSFRKDGQGPQDIHIVVDQWPASPQQASGLGEIIMEQPVSPFHLQ